MWREKRIGQEWLESVTEHPNFIPPLPFEPIVLEEARLGFTTFPDDQIDHSVAPVPQEAKGVEAGYKRWKNSRSMVSESTTTVQ